MIDRYISCKEIWGRKLIDELSLIIEKKYCMNIWKFLEAKILKVEIFSDLKS